LTCNVTRNLAKADKPRDAFRGQSRSRTWYHSIC